MGESTSGPAPQAQWDVARYARFALERSRPFHDLVARVPEKPFSRIADLGCGTGELTRTLLDRWPRALVWGVDDSEEMLARARSTPAPPGLRFVLDDLAAWLPPAPLDLIVSNAAIHWVPDHSRLLERLARLLAPGGTLAVQVPNNREEPAYRIVDDLLADPPWRDRLPGTCNRSSVESPSFYEQRLMELGLKAEVWETIYRHRLPGPRAILEWLEGSTLRPVVSALVSADAAAFLAALADRIAQAYPPAPAGVVFPFRRLFFVATREEDPHG